jgi:hypothetical protein
MVMAVEEEKARGNGGTPRSNGNSPNKQQQNTSSNIGAKDCIVVASNFTSQQLHNYDPNVWGVLTVTAISNNARKRHQVTFISLSLSTLKTVFRKQKTIQPPSDLTKSK